MTAAARARAAWRSGPLAQRNFQLLAGGQLKPETVPPATRKYIIDRPF